MAHGEPCPDGGQLRERNNGTTTSVTRVGGSSGCGYHLNGSSWITIHVKFKRIPGPQGYDLLRKGLSTTRGGEYKIEASRDTGGNAARATCTFRGSAATAKIADLTVTGTSATWTRSRSRAVSPREGCALDDRGKGALTAGDPVAPRGEAVGVATGAPLCDDHVLDPRLIQRAARRFGDVHANLSQPAALLPGRRRSPPRRPRSSSPEWRDLPMRAIPTRQRLLPARRRHPRGPAIPRAAGPPAWSVASTTAAQSALRGPSTTPGEAVTRPSARIAVPVSPVTTVCRRVPCACGNSASAPASNPADTVAEGDEHTAGSGVGIREYPHSLRPMLLSQRALARAPVRQATRRPSWPGSWQPPRCTPSGTTSRALCGQLVRAATEAVGRSLP